MARRTINRMEKRAEYEAYERRQEEEDRGEDDEDEEDDEEEKDDEGGGDADAEGDLGDDDDEEAPKKAKKPVKEKEVKKPKSRARTPKVVRMRLTWGVFNNSNVRVAVYDYPKRHEAEEHAARLTTDKKSTHFVQPVKEPIEEKKEA